MISNHELPYNDITGSNDYVILKLDSPLVLDTTVQQACLPPASYLPPTSTQKRCFTSGWGTLSQGMIFSRLIILGTLKSPNRIT